MTESEPNPNETPEVDLPKPTPQRLVFHIEQRMIGAQFGGTDGHEPALPLNSLSELLALRNVLLEAAKHRYRLAHSSRKKLPPGFESSLHFSLVGISDGSARLAHRVEVTPPLRLIKGNAKSKDSRIATLLDDQKAILDSFKGAVPKVMDLLSDTEDPNDRSRLSQVPSVLRAVQRLGETFDPRDAMEITSDVSDDTKMPRLRLYDSRRRMELMALAATDTEVISIRGVLRGVSNSGRCEVKAMGLPLLLTFDAPQDRRSISRKGLLDSCVEVECVLKRDQSGHIIGINQMIDIQVLDDPLDELKRNRDKSSAELPLKEQMKLIQTALVSVDFSSSPPLDGDALLLIQRIMRAFRTVETTSIYVLPRPFVFPTEERGIQAEWTLGKWRARATYSLDEDSMELFRCDLGIQDHGDYLVIPSISSRSDQEIAFIVGQFLAPMLGVWSNEAVTFDSLHGESIDD